MSSAKDDLEKEAAAVALRAFTAALRVRFDYGRGCARAPTEHFSICPSRLSGQSNNMRPASLAITSTVSTKVRKHPDKSRDSQPPLSRPPPHGHWAISLASQCTLEPMKVLLLPLNTYTFRS